MIPTTLLDKARLHIRRHFARHIPAWMAFHDLEHTLTVTRYALEIGRGCGVKGDDLRILELAALFHDTGYALAYKGHEEESAELATAFLAKEGRGRALQQKVTALIMATRIDAVPRTLLQKVLRDADSAKAGQLDFDEKSERLRKELQHARGAKIKPAEWTRENLAYLEKHRFFTVWAERRFGAQRTINLGRLRKLLARAPKAERLPTASTERFFDRDLSWLAFNARVLQEAQDERVPLLERIKFLAIHSSNLDEFYRVRVAQLRSLVKLGRADRSALDVPPEKRVQRINAEALRQQRSFGKVYRERLLPALARHGIRFRSEEQLDATQRTFVERWFFARIMPLLQTAALRPGNAPFIEDRKLYLVCELVQKGNKKRKRILLNVPSDELGRFIALPARKGRTELMFLDDALRLCAPMIFKGYRLAACHAIKLSRDAELYLDEEFAENVVDKVRRSLRKRRTGVPARFLYDSAMPPGMLRDLKVLVGVKRSDLIPGGRYHNFSDMMGLPVQGHPLLREKPLEPLPHPRLRVSTDVFASIAKGDVLLHFPYHDFRRIVDLLRKAARDPKVTDISITLYRVARGSLICEALLEAARNGKNVTAFVEVQARFDEGNNLFWGEALEQAGAHVIYSREGLKVHCKLCLIERREAGRLKRYCYLGTGNFNERTATIYGDMGLLTAHERIGQEVARVFGQLKDPKAVARTKYLLVAPEGLRDGIGELIDREITLALSGKAASILLKLNSIEDGPLIRKLYDASRAGVAVRLIVRGICCLLPGVPGLSDHISVISIVDRFLEHARAYVFHNSGHPLVYLSSADWMERNMDRRIEVAFPVLDAALKQEVLGFLELQWTDTDKARVIDARQVNTYRPGRYTKGSIRAQQAMYDRLRRIALGAPAKQKTKTSK